MIMRYSIFMKLKTEDIIKYAFVGIFAAIAVYFWPGYQKTMVLNNDPGKSVMAEINDLSPSAPLSLIIEPDQGIGPVIEAIKHASKSIDLIMYVLDDSDVEEALIDAQSRGIEVRVILDNSYHFGTKPNLPAYNYLRAHGVAVEFAKKYFPITHQKTLIIDNAFAIIMTFNLTPRYYPSGRDFAVIDNDARDVKAIEAAFSWDWQGLEKPAENGNDLVWSPGSSDMLLALINSASKSLDIYNEEMADKRITKAIEVAAARGVDVRVLMTYAIGWKAVFLELATFGVNVRTYASTASLYIHAKVLIIDGNKAFVGSENFSMQSLDANRELGILIARPEIISSLTNTFNDDWLSARPLGSVTGQIKKQSSSSESAAVIKLTSSGICHKPNNALYNRIIHYTAYTNLEDCLAHGGRSSANIKN